MAKETDVANGEKIIDGANERPIEEPIAVTAPGIPDDALLLGEELWKAPGDEEVVRIAVQLGAPDLRR